MTAATPALCGPTANTALARALARRERHRQRPLAVRALNLTAVAVLVAASVYVWLLHGFMPPLVVPAALALLALEFHWAARVLAWGLERLAQFMQRLRRLLRLTP